MSIVKSFDKALKRMEECNWDKIYVLVDLHDTIFEACYYENEEYKWYPYAKETLELMSHAKDISLILWTSTHINTVVKYITYLKKFGINFDMVNLNREVKNTDLSCFDEKTYFNVGIDDKFGFDAEIEWKTLYYYLAEAIRLGKLR